MMPQPQEPHSHGRIQLVKVSSLAGSGGAHAMNGSPSTPTIMRVNNNITTTGVKCAESSGVPYCQFAGLATCESSTQMKAEAISWHTKERLEGDRLPYRRSQQHTIVIDIEQNAYDIDTTRTHNMKYNK